MVSDRNAMLMLLGVCTKERGGRRTGFRVWEGIAILANCAKIMNKRNQRTNFRG